MRGWFANWNKIAGLLDRGGDGLTGEEIIARKHRPVGFHGGSVLGEPALRGVTLTVLLFGAIPGGDELWRQRRDLLMARCHDARAEQGMEIFDAAIVSFPGGAARTVDFS